MAQGYGAQRLQQAARRGSAERHRGAVRIPSRHKRSAPEGVVNSMVPDGSRGRPGRVFMTEPPNNSRKDTLVRSPRRYGSIIRITVGLCCVAALAAACGSGNKSSSGAPSTTSASGGKENPKFAALVHKANQEGHVVLYLAGNPASAQALGDAFQKAYPDIKFDFLRDSSAVLQDRIKSERAAGKLGGDVFMSSNLFWAQDELTAGRIAHLTLSAENQRVQDHCVQGGAIGNAGTDLIGLVYNTGIIKNPKTLNDFVGKPGGLNTPKTSNIVPWVYDTWGYDFLRKLHRGGAHITINQGAPEAISNTASGEQAFGLANATQVAPVKKTGAPIKLFLPPLPAHVPGFETPTVAFSDGPDPAAAQVLVNFILSYEGQSIYNKGSGVSCRPDVTDDIKSPSNLVLFQRKYATQQYINQGIQRFDKIFGG